MPAYLLDINALLAFAWKTHVHHELVSHWMAQHTDLWATCPFTQCGFVRISSNPKYATTPLPVPAALEILRDLTKHPNHVFWPDSSDLRSSSFPPSPLRGHQQITDAYLLSLTLENAGRLVTLDSGLNSLARDQSQRDAILLLRAP